MKAFGSAAAIACNVTMYHRSLRSFLLGRAQQGFLSSLLYFTWNLLLIFPRLGALALFAYALPCYIFTHFLCCWVVLVFVAWCSKTTLMDSPGGEWLYRATVGLIWYFSWFNVVEGRTALHSLLYHVWMLLDLGLLCGLAYWQTYNAAGAGGVVYIAVMGGGIVGVYVLGLLVKLLYYQFFHPKLGRAQPAELSSYAANGKPSADLEKPRTVADADVPDFGRMLLVLGDSVDCSSTHQEKKAEEPVNRRMKHLAHNFYF